jgi:hypothetical protein
MGDILWRLGEPNDTPLHRRFVKREEKYGLIYKINLSPHITLTGYLLMRLRFRAMISSSSLAAFSATNIPSGPRPNQADTPGLRPPVQRARANNAEAPAMQALPTTPPAKPPPRGSLLNLSV